MLLPLLSKILFKSKSQLCKLLGIFLLGLTSCGYRTAASEDKTTISVPYVQGDEQGQLTAEIIRQLANSDVYDFVKDDGDLVLKVAMVGDRNDIVGFRYDRTRKKGKIERNLMATENRRMLVAEVTLLRSGSEEIVMGPVKISATGDYDYIDVNSLKELSFINPQGKREKTMKFSLGQLDSIEGAQDAVLTPIYRQLAQKIAAALQKNITMPSGD
jgi:hypothetical protein